ncbi:hypothetical protein D6850_05190 [Roseovarius spongiae]|uniref:Uncharacterized protein n=1 Tax=Roseovarius spongiae TaxID=2320272 RepID=A0A3A8AYG7_9RHOB|nr:hypothetical protein [Roseovarius spongiae]RKF16926.1 hypothetical protein D6850_05190 [Roseovarius spongiae]
MGARMTLWLGLGALAVAGAAWLLWPRGPSAEEIAARYAAPLPAPEGPLRVYHLGHSLVGRDMPAMLAQLAGEGHRYESQLGWGASLRQHWEPDETINGFDAENDHPRHRPAREAVGSGDYDAVILTEMVEIKDAIKYHDSAQYLRKWADLARAADPAPRLYLYETWHRLDDPGGWLLRLDADLARYWEDALLFRTLDDAGAPMRLIPAGQVMAHFVRTIETMGGVGNVQAREDLFQRKPDGGVDPIHVNDLGAYLVALTHYAVLYHRSPVGLPHALRRADGTAADAPGPRVARLMQESVWDVVMHSQRTGVAQ